MNRRILIGLVLITAVSLAGCQTEVPAPEPVPVAGEREMFLVPLTREMVELAQSGGIDLPQLQFYISKSIIMERRTHTPGINQQDNQLLFTGQYEQLVISLDGQTAGAILSKGGISTGPDGSMTLELCFDYENSGNKLKFSHDGKDPEDFFYLEYDHQAGYLTNYKGSILYGGGQFDLDFAGKPPYLLIQREDDVEFISDIHRLPGYPLD
ncbi:MAG: hypothetical protein LBT11_00125 [Treponema sp.]|nr:hypothetical protein [Treponema sp.]